jgi:hypothetical protein
MTPPTPELLPKMVPFKGCPSPQTNSDLVDVNQFFSGDEFPPVNSAQGLDLELLPLQLPVATR